MNIYTLTLEGKVVGGPREITKADGYGWRKRLAKIKGVHVDQIILVNMDEPIDLKTATKSQLVDIAVGLELNVPSKATKAQLIEAIGSV